MPTPDRPRILFLARRYPPSVGGIQTYAYHLHSYLRELADVRLIALGRNHIIHLAWFVPWALLVALLHIVLRRPDVVYFNDGVIACLATLLKPFTRARLVVTVHALEMTYSVPGFSHLIRWGVFRCDAVVAVSHATKVILRDAGVDPGRIEVIYQGIEAAVLPEYRHREVRIRFEQDFDIRFSDCPVLLTYGRQIRRKGVAEFLERGLPLLRDDILLLVGGVGAESERIKSLVREHGLADRVEVLGLLDDDVLAMLRKEADLFLMPNIRVPGDVEGFGMAPLEAMFAGTPVVAFAVDALVESAREGGFLAPPDDYQAFVDRIHRFYAGSPAERQAAGDAAREYVQREYSWTKTAEQYLDLFCAKQ